MVENGHVTTGQWSYYAGDWEYLKDDWRESERQGKEFKSKLKTVGVDWDKTEEPISSLESAFTDTFHESESVETLVGVIVLKDGSSYTVGVNNAAMDFVAYAKMAKDKKRNEERVKDIFGE